MKKIILKGTLPSLKFQNVFWTKNDSGASLRTQNLSVGCIFESKIMTLYKMTKKIFQNSKISNNLGISSEFSQYSP